MDKVVRTFGVVVHMVKYPAWIVVYRRFFVFISKRIELNCSRDRSKPAHCVLRWGGAAALATGSCCTAADLSPLRWLWQRSSESSAPCARWTLASGWDVGDAAGTRTALGCLS
eukprot:scaffold75924_cov63-Phaeocystis_antarctica.AAC.5